ncbi:MAG: hypothetical protein WAN17_16290 [Candidatus Sulfotelmatobacter sp.]
MANATAVETQVASAQPKLNLANGLIRLVAAFAWYAGSVFLSAGASIGCAAGSLWDCGCLE